MSEHDRFPQECLLGDSSTYLLLGNKLLQNTVAQNNSHFFIWWFHGLEQIWRRNFLHLTQFLLENFTLKMRFFNNMSHKNWDGVEKQYFEGFGWFVCFSWCCWRSLGGQQAGGGFGESKRAHLHMWCLGLSWGCHHSATCCLSSRVLTGSGTSYMAAEASKRKPHSTIYTHLHLTYWLGSHTSSQIQGREHKCHLLVERGSKKLRPVF